MSLLFEPIALRGATARNRIWISPMCQYSVEGRDGVATAWHSTHLGALARGGAGLVFTEATAVVPEGRISPQDLGLWNDEQRDALAPIVDLIHDQGALAGVQLAHAGRKASTWREWTPHTGANVPADEGGWQPVAPSPLPFPEYAAPAQMDSAGIDAVVEAFASSARRAMEAGFDVMEIHAAHGYLLHEFLSPLSNHRTDGYGGSLENRSRLLVRVVDAVRAAVDQSVPLTVRLSAEEWTDGGFGLAETVRVVRRLGEHGVDLADISSGGNVLADIPTGPGYQVPLAAKVKADTDVAVSAVGLITEPVQAEQILVTGQADVVLIGRAALRDPNFPIRAANELGDPLPVPPQYARAWA